MFCYFDGYCRTFAIISMYFSVQSSLPLSWVLRFFSSSLISMLVLLEFLLRFYPKAMEQYENIQTHKTTNDEREREQDSDLPCLRYHSVESCSQHAHLTTTQPIIVHSSETIHVRKTTKSHSSDIIDGEFAPIYYIILE